MAPDADPHRTLGLAVDASIDDVRRAYRRLAKVHHPDAAGEKALPRFLAIQAAYEQIIGAFDKPAGRRRTPPQPRRPWQADPDRSGATRRAYGGRARGTPPGGTGGPGGEGASAGHGGPGTPGGSGEADPAGAGSAGAGRRRRTEPRGASGARPDVPPPGADGGPPKKATLGSTSYDGADAGPFEPDWGGASWYGTTSGTYWTLNPKEYADPRKHGPEYQARARRATRTKGSGATDTEAAAAPADPPAGPTHTTSSWWESTAGPAGPADPTDPAASDPTTRAGASSGTRPRPTTSRPVAPASDRPLPDLERAAADIGRALTDGQAGGLRRRITRAIIGWLPMAVAVGWLAGELTGCGRFAATCEGTADPLILLIQGAVLVGLLLVPSVASVAATGSIVLLLAAVGAALILSISERAPEGDARPSSLGAVLLVAWLIGITIAIVRRVRSQPLPMGPVS